MSVDDIANQSSVIFGHDCMKRPIFGVLDSEGSAETLVRRGGITNFFQQYICQKLPKSVDVH